MMMQTAALLAELPGRLAALHGAFCLVCSVAPLIGRITVDLHVLIELEHNAAFLAQLWVYQYTNTFINMIAACAFYCSDPNPWTYVSCMLFFEIFTSYCSVSNVSMRATLLAFPANVALFAVAIVPVLQRLQRWWTVMRHVYRSTDSPATPDGLRCVVCLERQREVLFTPCTHLVCCSVCARHVGNSCPVCRGYVSGLISVQALPTGHVAPWKAPLLLPALSGLLPALVSPALMVFAVRSWFTTHDWAAAAQVVVLHAVGLPHWPTVAGWQAVAHLAARPRRVRTAAVHLLLVHTVAWPVMRDLRGVVRAAAAPAAAEKAECGPADPGCVMCHRNARAVVFGPCAHLACCLACAGTVAVCPSCTAPVQEIFPVFT